VRSTLNLAQQACINEIYDLCEFNCDHQGYPIPGCTGDVYVVW
jgi:hypothetical protein